MSEWISVKDRLPPVTGHVLAAAVDVDDFAMWQEVLNYYICPEYKIGLWETLGCEDFEDADISVTHWMKLPLGPSNA